ncbi:MAG: glycine cleavage system protein GcvH [Spirochaetes bacterium]|nr:MAG: glycine cleavage system protein GcvH [Spirochaetota bacterium]
MEIPKDLKYTNEHEWARIEGDIATVGITDYAQESLGDVVYIETPEIGTKVKKGEELGSIESVKAVSDVFSPISGEIVEVNEELADHPEYINQSPYDKGWIVKIKISNPEEADELMDNTKYEKFVKMESEKH